MSFNKGTQVLICLERHLGACNLRMHFQFGRSLDHQTICDAVQDALVQAAQHFDPQQHDHARAYLMTIARNNCLKEIQRLKRISFTQERDVESHLSSSSMRTGNLLSKASAARIDLQRVVDFLDEMRPIRQRDALILSISGYSSAEIAAELGLTSGSAAVLVCRARRQLRWQFPNLSHPKKHQVVGSETKKTLSGPKQSRSAGSPTKLAHGRSK